MAAMRFFMVLFMLVALGANNARCETTTAAATTSTAAATTTSTAAATTTSTASEAQTTTSTAAATTSTTQSNTPAATTTSTAAATTSSTSAAATTSSTVAAPGTTSSTAAAGTTSTAAAGSTTTTAAPAGTTSTATPAGTTSTGAPMTTTTAAVDPRQACVDFAARADVLRTSGMAAAQKIPPSSAYRDTMAISCCANNGFLDDNGVYNFFNGINLRVCSAAPTLDNVGCPNCFAFVSKVPGIQVEIKFDNVSSCAEPLPITFTDVQAALAMRMGVAPSTIYQAGDPVCDVVTNRRKRQTPANVLSFNVVFVNDVASGNTAANVTTTLQAMFDNGDAISVNGELISVESSVTGPIDFDVYDTDRVLVGGTTPAQPTTTSTAGGNGGTTAGGSTNGNSNGNGNGQGTTAPGNGAGATTTPDNMVDAPEADSSLPIIIGAVGGGVVLIIIIIVIVICFVGGGAAAVSKRASGGYGDEGGYGNDVEMRGQAAAPQKPKLSVEWIDEDDSDSSE